MYFDVLPSRFGRILRLGLGMIVLRPHMYRMTGITMAWSRQSYHGIRSGRHQMGQRRRYIFRWQGNRAGFHARTRRRFCLQHLQRRYDSDGLRDDLEARQGTDPTQADTDGDGRSDLDEVTGYSFVYASGKSTWVRSNRCGGHRRRWHGRQARVHAAQNEPHQYPYNPNAVNALR